MDRASGVGVIDKVSLLLDALESGPASLNRLVASTGLTRPTVHRLALALERVRLIGRDRRGRFVLGERLGELGVQVDHEGPNAVAAPILGELSELTGGSARLYRRLGEVRVCVSAVDGPEGLRDAVAVGAALPMRSGPAAQVLLAWEDPERMYQGLRGATFDAVSLALVRRRGWAQSLGAGMPPVAVLAAPVRGRGDRVVGAVSVAGSVARLTRDPGRRYGGALIDAGLRLGAALSGAERV